MAEVRLQVVVRDPHGKRRVRKVGLWDGEPAAQEFARQKINELGLGENSRIVISVKNGGRQGKTRKKEWRGTAA
jgi:hypothetical protein